ncbi:MAG: hypothetical protein WAK00_13965 [Microbacterium sp.]|uniref:hypothetical protein n=1 Tax=Microbacterium sp. TaxID=51671 RepID=UPI003BAE17D5
MPSTGARLKAMQAWHRHQNFVRMVDHLRTHPCVDCGETDPVVLDFDHLPGLPKKFEVARAVNASTRAWSTIAAEIMKCEVVCANCHRRRTARRGGHRKYLLAIGLPVPAPSRVEVLCDKVPHGGRTKGRRGCRCELCRERRKAYARELRSAAAQRRNLGLRDTEELENVGNLEGDPQ